MKTSHGLGAIAALSLAVAASADSALVSTLDLGTFLNNSPGSITHTGPFNQFISATMVPGIGTTQHTVISINLAGLLDAVGADGLRSVTIRDTGLNTYGSLSPGADIDWFVFENMGGTTIDYMYNGPNPVHNNEDPSRWRERVSFLDSFSGAQDAWNLTHLSLGNLGALTATISSPSGPDGGLGALIGPPVLGGLNPTLVISEHGTVESFRVTLQTFVLVPSPGALALLGLAGAVGRRRRS